MLRISSHKLIWTLGLLLLVLAAVVPSYGINFPWQEKKQTVGEKVVETAKDFKNRAEATKDTIVDKASDWRHTAAETIKDIRDFDRGGKEDLKWRAEEVGDRVRAEAHHAAHRINENFRDVRDKIEDKAEEVGDKFVDRAHHVKEDVEHFGRDMRHRAEHAKEYAEDVGNNVKEYLEEKAYEAKTSIEEAGHPILIGVASITCLILGAYFFFAFKDDALDRWEATKDYGKRKTAEAKVYAKDKLNRANVAAHQKAAHFKEDYAEKHDDLKARLRSADSDAMMES
jgi:hypothetical protein